MDYQGNNSAYGIGCGCLVVILVLGFIGMFFKGLAMLVRLIPIALVLGICLFVWYTFFRKPNGD